MKKQTLVTILVLALSLSAIAKIQLVDMGTAYAKPTVTDISVSNNASVHFSPDEGLNALLKQFESDKENILRQMEQEAIKSNCTPPKVSILSVIENQTYSTNNITLSFTVSQPSTFEYNNNGQENITIAGNTTLTGLSVGPQSLVVYAKDIFGKVGTSETVNFMITQQKEPEPQCGGRVFSNCQFSGCYRCMWGFGKFKFYSV